uniref:Integral membrane protein 2 n=1 Tax=Glossina brevipalpis TaxID=37001 RepID=A0A1A9WJ72_9MUSC
MPAWSEEKRADIFLHRPGFGKRDYKTAAKQENSLKSSQPDIESIILSGAQFSCLKVVLLFVIPLSMIVSCVLSGYIVYRINMLTDVRVHYRALCVIPYEPFNNTTKSHIYTNKNFLSVMYDKNIENFDIKNDHSVVFREMIEMDISDEESYATVEVPKFKNIQRARFIHDFEANQTAIIDVISNRCFVMPLDYETIMTPKNFVNLITTGDSNYLNISAERIKRIVVVLTPFFMDLVTLPKRMAEECFDMLIYKTEIYKAEDFRNKIKLKAPVTYAEYLGIAIIEFNIINMKKIEEYEHQLWK